MNRPREREREERREAGLKRDTEGTVDGRKKEE